MEPSAYLLNSFFFLSSLRIQFVIVQKSKMMYPHVWWAHPWPFTSDMEKDGIFLEAHTRDAHSTWFIVSRVQLHTLLSFNLSTEKKNPKTKSLIRHLFIVLPCFLLCSHSKEQKTARFLREKFCFTRNANYWTNQSSHEAASTACIACSQYCKDPPALVHYRCIALMNV